MLFRPFAAHLFIKRLSPFWTMVIHFVLPTLSPIASAFGTASFSISFAKVATILLFESGSPVGYLMINHHSLSTSSQCLSA